MVKLEKDNIIYNEILVIESDADNRTFTSLGITDNKMLILINGEEYDKGNAYSVSEEYYLLNGPEFINYLIKAKNNGHIDETDYLKYKNKYVKKLAM